MKRPILQFVTISLLMLFASARALRPVERTTATETLWHSWQKGWCVDSRKLVCSFIPTANSKVHGTVLFAASWSADTAKCGVSITARISGLAKNTKQAIHIHSYGDTTSRDGKSLGGHFSSPSMRKGEHGMPNDKKRHWGDFGSLESNEDGYASYNRFDHLITINGIVGRGMVIHRDADKGAASQPSGGAGPRKAMCVIGYANPKTKINA